MSLGYRGRLRQKNGFEITIEKEVNEGLALGRPFRPTAGTAVPLKPPSESHTKSARLLRLAGAKDPLTPTLSPSGYGVQRCDSSNGRDGAQIPGRHSREGGNPVIGTVRIRVVSMTWTFLYWVPAFAGTTLRRILKCSANGQVLSEYHPEMLRLSNLFESRSPLGRRTGLHPRRRVMRGSLSERINRIWHQTRDN
jgi:hypothetical protein